MQIYQPSCFAATEDVAVSGLDLSKDRKELLVSYENDQIYTFPVFPSHVSDPSIDDMLSLLDDDDHEVEASKSAEVHNSHFAGYGGHLNRFTFLKVSYISCFDPRL